jgi:hypothetical protein
MSGLEVCSPAGRAAVEFELEFELESALNTAPPELIGTGIPTGSSAESFVRPGPVPYAKFSACPLQRTHGRIDFSVYETCTPPQLAQLLLKRALYLIATCENTAVSCDRNLFPGPEQALYQSLCQARELATGALEDFDSLFVASLCARQHHWK